MEHTDAEARAIWADQDSMPDVLNQEPQSVCTVEDFDVIKPNMYTILMDQCELVDLFMDSGGTLKAMLHPSKKVYFSAVRDDKRIVGYGETPYEAIRLWAYKTKANDC